MKYAIIGLGDFGTATAIGLAKRGAEVIAVDSSHERVNAIKDQVALAVRMDASQVDAMRLHGINEVDVLITSITKNFEAQVMVVVHAKQAGVRRIIARATSADHARALRAIGADEVFNPEEESARWTVQRLLVQNISSYFELADGFSIVEVPAPKSILRKTIRELSLRKNYRINLLAIKTMKTDPEGNAVVTRFNPVPDPEHRISENEVLALAGSVLDIANFLGVAE